MGPDGLEPDALALVGLDPDEAGAAPFGTDLRR